MKELVDIIGTIQAKALLEFLNGKLFFKMVYDFRESTIDFRHSDLDKTTQIVVKNLRKFDAAFYKEFGFMNYYENGSFVINVRWTPFNAQPYLEQLNQL